MGKRPDLLLEHSSRCRDPRRTPTATATRRDAKTMTSERAATFPDRSCERFLGLDRGDVCLGSLCGCDPFLGPWVPAVEQCGVIDTSGG